MLSIRRRIGVPLVLGSFAALFLMADVAVASHTVPIGASPIRVSLVPAFAPCETGVANSTHGPPLNFPSCNPPQLVSSTVKIGGNAIGFARIVVCPVGTTAAFCTATGGAMPLPDVRLTGSGRDIQCRQTGIPPGCTAGGDYNPNATAGPYTSTGGGTAAASPACFPAINSATTCIAGTDITATAELATAAASIGGTGQFAGHAIRVSDHYNCDPLAPPADPNACPADPSTSTRAATMTDLQFPVPVDCIPTGTADGSTCGVNTTANALVPNSVIPNKAAVVEVGEIILKDSGPNGVRGDGDDQVFSAQGILLP